MARPAQLSSDNLLRFLQVRRDPATTEDILAGLHVRRADRHALYKMLGQLKRRGLVGEALGGGSRAKGPGGRYRRKGRTEGQSGDGQGGRERSRSQGEMPGKGEPRGSRPAGSGGAVAAHHQSEGPL